ncbi:hypothetical protein DFH06DRAFT_1131601 [Mycena polygramma]|nr:hypothetical protein DFH06DRAFT_1131601 [Mycena polygramma]
MPHNTKHPRSSRDPPDDDERRRRHAEAQSRYRQRNLAETRRKARLRMGRLRAAAETSAEGVALAAARRRPVDADYRERKFIEKHGLHAFAEHYLPLHQIFGQHLPGHKPPLSGPSHHCQAHQAEAVIASPVSDGPHDLLFNFSPPRIMMLDPATSGPACPRHADIPNHFFGRCATLGVVIFFFLGGVYTVTEQDLAISVAGPDLSKPNPIGLQDFVITEEAPTDRDCFLLFGPDGSVTGAKRRGVQERLRDGLVYARAFQ